MTKKLPQIDESLEISQGPTKVKSWDTTKKIEQCK